MAELHGVYQRARYYDIAFRRDVSNEVEFLARLFAQHAKRPLASMLDVACGPGYHARDFARMGVKAYGLDLRPEMVAFARDEAEAEGTRVEWFAADMRDFTLPQPVDLILTSYDSIDCLTGQDEIIEHFKTVGRNLAPKGLYVYELTHPRDCSLWNYGSHSYEGERDGIRVRIDWAVNHPAGDPFTQLTDVEVVMHVNDHGKTHEFHDRARERFCLPQEFVMLARISGALEAVRFLGDYRFDQPFDNTPGSRRMIGVFQRTD